MIEQLHFGRIARQVGHFVDDRQAALADFGFVGRLEPQLLEQEPRFVDQAGQAHFARGVVDRQLDMMGRPVGDPPVQRILVDAAGPELRRTVALQPAAAHQLVESFQPAQAAGLGERHELRMHGPFDRRLPADFGLAQPALPQAHAARRHDDEAELAVVDFDRIDALAHSAGERNTPDTGLARQLHGKVQLVDAFCAVGQNRSLPGHFGCLHWSFSTSAHGRRRTVGGTANVSHRHAACQLPVDGRRQA